MGPELELKTWLVHVDDPYNCNMFRLLEMWDIARWKKDFLAFTTNLVRSINPWTFKSKLICSTASKLIVRIAASFELLSEKQGKRQKIQYIRFGNVFEQRIA